MGKFLIKNIQMINEGRITKTNLLLENGIIEKIGEIPKSEEKNVEIIDGTNLHLFPGIIDGQVHFREPGLTHKGDLHSESKAGIAGGTTSFIDMPNTVPNTLNLELLEEKYRLASEKSLANFGFFLGINAENLEEILKIQNSELAKKLLGLSDDGLYFSKKGNLLTDNPVTMEQLFSNWQGLIAIHSEKEEIIEKNEEFYRSKYGENPPIHLHPSIRNEKACFEATKRAISLANKHHARLHILHLTTEAETHLFRNDIPLQEKNITTEVCVQHLWFCDRDYDRLGTLIKWNPAIKSEKDKKGLLKALIEDKIDMVTTDHAPHTLAEKQKPYFQAMSGAPIIQHSLNIMLEFFHQGLISLEKIVEKMCHNPAIIYGIEKRGFIREGYAADLTLVNLNSPWQVNKENILAKCAWSPLTGTIFQSRVIHTFVNGNHIYNNGIFNENAKGQALRRKPDSNQ